MFNAYQNGGRLSQDPLIELNKLMRKLRQDIPVGEPPPSRLDRLRAHLRAGPERCATWVREAFEAVRTALGMRPSVKQTLARAALLVVLAGAGVLFWAVLGIIAVRWMLQHF